MEEDNICRNKPYRFGALMMMMAKRHEFWGQRIGPQSNNYYKHSQLGIPYDMTTPYCDTEACFHY
jgi:hypothetical protein